MVDGVVASVVVPHELIHVNPLLFAPRMGRLKLRALRYCIPIGSSENGGLARPCQTTRCHIPEVQTLVIHLHVNLTSHLRYITCRKV